MNYNFRSEITNAKGYGASKSGAHHWLLQRITGIILAACSIWLMYFILTNKHNTLDMVIVNIKTPFNIVFFLIFILTSFYHAMLGMRIVIEDYISCNKLRTILIIGLQLFCTITIVAFIVTLFYKN